jgi:hypothetical protein
MNEPRILKNRGQDTSMNKPRTFRTEANMNE